MTLLKKYRYSLLMMAIVAVLYSFNHTTGQKAFTISLQNIGEMLTFLPPIFILVGLLDVWVPKETMIKYMGHDSGIKGILIAFFLGSAAAGPLYAAFPVAALLLKKGARLAYVIFFLGAWSSTKLPLVIYESTSLGFKFTSIHIAISIAGYLLTAFFIERITTKETMEYIYEKAQDL